MSDFCLFGISLEDDPEIGNESKGKKRKRDEEEGLQKESGIPISTEKINQLESSLSEKCIEIKRKMEENEVLKSSLDFSEKSLKKLENDVKMFKQKNDDLEKLVRIFKRGFENKAANSIEKANAVKYQTLEDQYKIMKEKNIQLTRKLQILESLATIKKEEVYDVKENQLKELTKKMKEDESKYKKLEEENKNISKKLSTLEEQHKILKEKEIPPNNLHDPKKLETLTTEYEAKLVRKNEAIRKLMSYSRIKAARIQMLHNILRRLWRTLEGVSAVSSSSSLDLVKLIQTQILIEVHPLDPALNIMSPEEKLTSLNEDLEVNISPNETVPSQPSTQFPAEPNTLEIVTPQPTLESTPSNPFSWDLRNYFSPQELNQQKKEQEKVNKSATSPDPPKQPSQTKSTTTMNSTLPPQEQNTTQTKNQENGSYFDESLLENIFKLCFGVTCDEAQKQLAFNSPEVPESSKVSQASHIPYNTSSHPPTASHTTSLVSSSHNTHSASRTTSIVPPSHNNHPTSITRTIVSPPHSTSYTRTLVTTPSRHLYSPSRHQYSPTRNNYSTTPSRHKKSSASSQRQSRSRVSYHRKSSPTYYHPRSPTHSSYYQSHVRNPPDYYQAPLQYRREVCSYWKRGCCPHGDSCPMAHSY